MTSQRWDDDGQLLADLAAALQEDAALSEQIKAAAKAAFCWRTIDEDLATLDGLATLDYDSLLDDAVLVRGSALTAPRNLVFSGRDLTVEIEVTDDGILGQLVPPGPGRVRLLTPDRNAVDTEVDEIGCFRIGRSAPGVVRLHCLTETASLVTDWVRL